MDGEFHVGSQRAVAEFFGQRPRTIERWRAEGMPGDRGAYCLKEILAWAIDAGKVGQLPADDDLMTGAAESEGLERYRMAKAQQEEIKLAEKRGQVVLMDQFNDCVRVALAPLRKVQETFKRRGDRESIQLIHEAIDEMERGLAQLGDVSGKSAWT
ncbi:MAG: hypothetical protein KDA91_14885 [Planctomycetaceae bacterium]|nr:hypothetical protein [Planctomycetaceae bacterium]